MYNFSILSQLKPWIDALSVPGFTFQYGPTGPEGLLGEKRVVIASARGNLHGAGTPAAALDHQETYLRTFLGSIPGVTRFTVVRAEGLKVSDEMRRLDRESGLRQVAEQQTP